MTSRLSSSARAPNIQKKNRADAAAFAKQFGRCVSLSRCPESPSGPVRPLRVFFQDESRLGLPLPTPRRLTGCGVKPIQPVAPVYQSDWLYAAVEPATGEAYWLEMPPLDSGCFETFLNHLSQYYSDSLNLVVVDNASAHTASTLTQPDNLLLLN